MNALILLAAAMAPIAPPELGPVERPARPLVLVFQPLRVTAYNPMSEGLVGGVMEHLSGNRFDAAVEKVRQKIPDIDVAAEIRAGFRCGEPGSLCSEAIVLEKVGELSELMQSRQWSSVRLLSTWWEEEKRSLLSRASLTEIERKEDKLVWKHPIPVMYAITAPKGPGAVPHADEWEYGSPVPHEAALRKSIHGLEPMLQMSLSWGVNNEAISKQRVAEHGRDQIRRYRPQGLECSSLAQCNAGFDSATDDRTWVWHYVDVNRSSPARYIVELQSRPRIDP